MLLRVRLLSLFLQDYSRWLEQGLALGFFLPSRVRRVILHAARALVSITRIVFQ